MSDLNVLFKSFKILSRRGFYNELTATNTVNFPQIDDALSQA